MEGTRAGVYWHSVGRRPSITLGKYTTVFQAEVYAVFACVYEIQTQIRPEKYVSICSDCWAVLKVLQDFQKNVTIGATVPKGVEWYL